MKHKISELEGALLDAAVAKAEGRMPWHGWVSPGQACTEPPLRGQFEEYSSDWRNGGPIIERERMIVTPSGPVGWGVFYANEFDVSPDLVQYRAPLNGRTGPTPLIAAMRAYIASKFGEEVELP